MKKVVIKSLFYYVCSSFVRVLKFCIQIIYIVKYFHFGNNLQKNKIPFQFFFFGSIVVGMPACHAGDQGSILRWKAFFNFFLLLNFRIYYMKISIFNIFFQFDSNLRKSGKKWHTFLIIFYL